MQPGRSRRGSDRNRIKSRNRSYGSECSRKNGSSRGRGGIGRRNAEAGKPKQEDKKQKEKQPLKKKQKQHRQKERSERSWVGGGEKRAGSREGEKVEE